MKQPTQAEILEEGFGDHPRCCVFCREEVPTRDALRIHVFDKHGRVVSSELRQMWRKHSDATRIAEVAVAWYAEYARYSYRRKG